MVAAKVNVVRAWTKLIYYLLYKEKLYEDNGRSDERSDAAVFCK